MKLLVSLVVATVLQGSVAKSEPHVGRSYVLPSVGLWLGWDCVISDPFCGLSPLGPNGTDQDKLFITYPTDNYYRTGFTEL